MRKVSKISEFIISKIILKEKLIEIFCFVKINDIREVNI